MSAFIAVDWGTTNRRVYRIVDGHVEATERDDRGVTTLDATQYDGEVAAIRGRFGDLPMLLAGMVGSTIGWRVAPYVAVPAGLDAVSANLLEIDERTRIVPGLCQTDGDRADVMRGEEVQFLGALAAGLVPADALLCQPGTHCKWAAVKAGQLVRFNTAMTGELFAMLRAHSLLSPQMAGDVTAGDAFCDGVRDGAERDLGATLFGVRAASVLGMRPDADAASYVSGVLIGSDVAVRVAAGEHVHILADPALGELYRMAIEKMGGTADIVDSHSAFVSGITAIQEHHQ